MSERVASSGATFSYLRLGQPSSHERAALVTIVEYTFAETDVAAADTPSSAVGLVRRQDDGSGAHDGGTNVTVNGCRHARRR